MDEERLKTIRKVCETVGIASLLIYILTTISGEVAFIPYRVFLSLFAAIAYSINAGIEVAKDEDYLVSVFFIFVSVFYCFVSLI